MLNTTAVLSVNGKNLACRTDVTCFKVARAVRLELEEYTEKNEIIASKDRKGKIMRDKAILNLKGKNVEVKGKVVFQLFFFNF